MSLYSINYALLFTDGHYYEWVIPQEKGILQPLAGKAICRRCHARCKICIGYGFHEQVCQKCTDYKRGEQCEDECPGDHYVDATQSECLPCNPECQGCTGSGPQNCLQCRTLKIYNGDPTDNSTIFNCTASCPDDYPFKMYTQDPLGPYCSAEAATFGFLAETPEATAVIIGALVGLVMVVVLCTGVMYYYYQKMKAKKEKLDMAIGIDLMHCDDAVSLRPTNVGPNLTKLRIIKVEELRISTLLGTGEFASVYKGTWAPQNQNRKNMVAIKILKKVTGPESSKEFLEEASLMATLEHTNILKLQAICMTSQIMLITQIMTNGSSLSYVRKEREKTGSKNLLNWCTQIARGMAYLEERRLVHRDLAARNVLVDNNTNIKIADFGLAKILSTDSDEYMAEAGKMPIKWLALECIQNRIFTNKSDVWAFGVTTWELLTFGKRPYEDTAAKDVPALIESGQRLESPPYCSVEIFKTLLWCWHKRSSLRPSFKDLVEEFSKFASDPGRYLCIPGDKYQRAPLYIGQNSIDVIRNLPDVTDAETTLVSDEYLQTQHPSQSRPGSIYFSKFSSGTDDSAKHIAMGLPLDEDDYLITSSQAGGKAGAYMDLIGTSPAICIDNPEYLMGSINPAAPIPTQTIGIPVAPMQHPTVSEGEPISDHEYYNDFQRELQPLHQGSETTV